MVWWMPNSKATFSLVPTPSALETSTGCGKLLQVQRKEAAESADLREYMLVECLARQHLDALLGAVARGDVHPGVGVGGMDFCHCRLRICTRGVERGIGRGVGRLVCKGLVCEGRGGRIGRLFRHLNSLERFCFGPACAGPTLEQIVQTGRNAAVYRAALRRALRRSSSLSAAHEDKSGRRPPPEGESWLDVGPTSAFGGGGRGALLYWINAI